MSAADCRAAKRKMRMRYGNPTRKRRTVGEAIADERRRAAREAASKKKK